MQRTLLPTVVIFLVLSLRPFAVGGQQFEEGATPSDTLRLTLEAAERLALERNPVLAAARRAEAVASGNRRQAGVYQFNPQIEFETERLNATGAESAFDRYEALLTQELEWAGQWGLRKEAANHGVLGARASVQDAERRTLLTVRTAFYEAVAAHSKLEVAEEMAGVTERLREAVATQLAEGEVSALEANLAEIEYGRARGRVRTAQRALASATLNLARTIGVDPGTPLGIEPGGSNRPQASAPPLPDPAALRVDSLIQGALAHRPDLRAAQSATDEARTRERLARREAIPDLQLLVPVRRNTPGADPDIGLGVGFSVPLWNRNQGQAQARQAEVARSLDLREGVSLRVRTEVRDALQSYRSASQEVLELESSVLAPARQNRGLLEESYRAGKLDLPSLLLLRNQLLDAELSYWDAWVARYRAWARLQAAVGGSEDRGSAP